jgi:O-antigen ligase
MHLGHIAIGKSRASHDFGVVVPSPMEELSQGKSRWWVMGRQRWLDAALFFCFILFVLCAPIATKGAVTAFRAALLLWLTKILIERRKLERQPLALPLLLFLVFTTVSTIFSTEPLLSWGRMRGVTELTIALLVGQTLKNLRQVMTLTYLLLAACLVSVGITALQYTVGIGIKLTADTPTSVSVSQLGLLPGDIIQKVNRKNVLTQRQLFARLDQLPPDSNIELSVAREISLANLHVWTGSPFARLSIVTQRKALEEALRQPGVKLVRGRPLRAEGTLKHYFPYSEVMVLIGLVAWGLLVAPGADLRIKVLLGLAFLSISTVVVLTLTRISLASLLLGCCLITWKQVSGRSRRLILVAFFVALLLSVNWIQQHRAQKWMDLSDPGTQYRLLMWRDSLKFIRAHPIVGTGLDSIGGHWQRWDLEAYRRFPLKSHFHSTPIEFAVECGLPTLAVWLWLMGGYLVFLLRLSTSSRKAGWFPQGLASGILGGLLAVLLTSLLQYNFGDSEAMIVFWFLMGLAFALERILHNNEIFLRPGKSENV